MTALGTDPRFVEYRESRELTEAGLSAPQGSRERYQRAIAPYLECLAEHADMSPTSRKPLMRALFYEDRLPLGMILATFRASEREREFIADHPPLDPEPVDEIERLRQLPYGAYLKTEHWKRVRAEAVKRAGGRCTLCNSSEHLEVHHRSYARRGAERPADVYALCSSCHGHYHNKPPAA